MVKKQNDRFEKDYFTTEDTEELREEGINCCGLYLSLSMIDLCTSETSVVKNKMIDLQTTTTPARSQASPAS